MKTIRTAAILAGMFLASAMPQITAAQLAQVGRATDPAGQRRDELRRPAADRSKVDSYRSGSSSESRRENEVLDRLRQPNEYQRRQESPLERQRRESYEKQTQPPPQTGRQPLTLGACAPGFVRREAYSGDHACVTPEARAQVVRDNLQAPNRRNPTGAKGLDTCIEGYVWREAYPGDRVCVTPETRAQTARDNSEAVNRKLR